MKEGCGENMQLNGEMATQRKALFKQNKAFGRTFSASMSSKKDFSKR
jgi:hypothetical protein